MPKRFSLERQPAAFTLAAGLAVLFLCSRSISGSPASGGGSDPDQKILAGNSAEWRGAASDLESRYQVCFDGSRADLLTADGGLLLGLLPDLLVAYHQPGKPPAAESAPVAPRRLRFGELQAQTLPQGGLVIEGSAQFYGVSYRLIMTNASGDPRIRTRIEIAYSRDLLVHQEVLRYDTGPVGQATMLDRAYQQRAVDQVIFSDLLTPHRARFRVDQAGGGSFELIGGTGLQGLLVYPRPKGGYRLELEVDHLENHPFMVFKGCILNPTVRLPKMRMDETVRRSGDRKVAQWDWVVGETLPLLVGRFPRGSRAAIVFTDHADQSSKAKLEAFAFGRTGALAAGEQGPDRPGFVNRGLGYTKTVFLRKVGRYAAQFDDPDYRRILDAMAERGVELGVHSTSGYRDRPEPSEAPLREFRKAYRGRTWIDHQPNTNCEAIANLGWHPFTEWYFLGILAAGGFRYFGNVEDVPLWRRSLNLLSPELLSSRRPLLYPSGRLHAQDGTSLVQFASSWLFVRRERLLEWFTDAALDRLEAERGLLIGHTYFETFRPSGRHSGQSLLESDGGSGFRIRPEVDRLFTRLAERQAGGRLWVAGVEALAEHLLDAMEVEVEALPGGKAVVRSRSPRDQKGLTLLCPEGVARVLVDGEPPAGDKKVENWREVWFDLAPGQGRSVELQDSEGRAVELMQPARIELKEVAQ